MGYIRNFIPKSDFRLQVPHSLALGLAHTLNTFTMASRQGGKLKPLKVMYFYIL